MRTEFLNMSGPATSSIAGRGVARQSERPEGKFSRSLVAATQQVDAEAAAAAPVRKTAPPGSRDANIPSRISGSSEGSSRAAEPSSVAANPFAADSRQVMDVGGGSEWVAYFRTHAPGEWAADPRARERFAETYSDAALVTLDWTGTVPENMDPAWVTHCPVDSTGKPLPRVPSTELT